VALLLLDSRLLLHFGISVSDAVESLLLLDGNACVFLDQVKVLILKLTDLLLGLLLFPVGLVLVGFNELAFNLLIVSDKRVHLNHGKSLA